MRNHDEFMAEIYSRKDNYIKVKKQKRKTVLTFAIPFMLLIFAYSALVLPAMLPAKSANPYAEEAGTTAAEETATMAAEEIGNTANEVTGTTANENITAAQGNYIKTEADGLVKMNIDKAVINELLMVIDAITAVQEVATELDNQLTIRPNPTAPSEGNKPGIKIEISANGMVMQYVLNGNALTDLSAEKTYLLSPAQLQQLEQLI